MSDRPKASAPKTPVSAAPARKAAAAGAPAAKSGTGSWLAGFITRAAAGIVYAVVFILCLVLGIVPTAIFVSVMSGLCCYEFFRMTRLDGKMANERMGIAAAVLFPLSALGDPIGNNRYNVRLLRNGETREREVVIGARNDTDVEIVKGLEEGDEVITGEGKAGVAQ